MVDAFDIQGEQFGQRYLNPRKQESINEPSVFQYSGQLDAAAHGRYYPILLRGVRRFVCGGITWTMNSISNHLPSLIDFQFQIIYLLHDDVKQDDQEACARCSLR